jgi:hypothetical protein
MTQKGVFPNQSPAGAALSAAPSETGQNKTAIVPSPDEIAKRAYFSYVNEGSLPGREEQQWLKAEAQLLREIAKGSGQHPG